MSSRQEARFHSPFNIQHSTFNILLFALLLILAPAKTTAADFRPALPGYTFEFPRDHGTHDEYRTEWWYYTGHLTTESGHRWGFELTFFRVGVVPPSVPAATRWDLHNLALAHFALTDVDGKRFRYYERLNRVSPFTAASAAGHLGVFNESWSATTMNDGSWHLLAAEASDGIDLVLRAAKPPAIHGENGISIKAAGEGYASHYYSMTRLEITGTLTSDGRREHCRGLAWMDHEFGSSALRESQQGWDWFSIQLNNDTELMLYQIRRTDGSPDMTSSGSIINSDGSVIHLTHDQMHVEVLGRWHSPESNATYPMGWRVIIPAFRIVLVLRPLVENQELITKSSTRVTYWEGAADASGTFGNTAVSGQGYVEMTGYDRAFRQP
ncbi:MAG TPA: lipocalin-like domain-containing protein [Thermoanaerobaculia bacterium]|nr:lipocalin-like domain-containing protein [Thermoanaerobaculia bacterium]